ncbi:hypothetical protein [Celeribacter arenosi]|uniref:Uncharacterized protein n=1 Tax=Celeribacter arenosi TaxID=792649 RepID=A0ABP7KF33_9RHOB
MPVSKSLPDVDANLDPGGLIRTAFEMEDLTPPDARTIFLDWAIKLDPVLDPHIAIRRLIALYSGHAAEGHPMAAVLREGLGATTGPLGRRGGARARR